MNNTIFFRLFVAASVLAVCALYIGWTKKSTRSIASQRPTDTDQAYYSETPDPIGDDSTTLRYIDISAPISYKNIQIYLIKGQADINSRNYVVLNQAIKQKLVTVRETGDVNELKIDNNSGEYVYINSGDIVKGGKQDRTIQYDVIIPPYKKSVDLASFCVEHGRWTSRQQESASSFSGSEKSLSSKELKVAAKHGRNQQEVWKKVDKYQNKANENLSKMSDSAPIDVKSPVSASSLQLTLDNETIIKATQAYRTQLLRQIRDRSGTLGFAYFINGKLYSIDIFNNHKLFTDMFDKLLDAAIAEAITEESGADSRVASAEEVRAALTAAAKIYEQVEVNEVTRFYTSEASSQKDLVIFTTIDKKLSRWLHRNWLDKTES